MTTPEGVSSTSTQPSQPHEAETADLPSTEVELIHDPTDQLRAHVAFVREHGDSLYNAMANRFEKIALPFGTFGILATIALGETIHLDLSGVGQGVLGCMDVVAATVATQRAFVTKHVSFRRKKQHTAYEQGWLACKEDTRYELFQTKGTGSESPKVQLLWTGRKGEDREGESLKQLAEMAQAAGVDEMLLPTDLLPASLKNLERKSMADFLTEERGIEVAGRAKEDMVLRRSPADILKVLSIESERLYSSHEVDVDLMQELERRLSDTDKNLLASFYKTDGADKSKISEEQIRRFLERAMTSIETKPAIGDDKAQPGYRKKSGGSTSSMREARITLDRVYFSSNGVPDSSYMSLEEALEMRDHIIKLAIDHPDETPERTALVLAYLMYAHLSTGRRPPVQLLAQKQQDFAPQPSRNVRGYQQDLKQFNPEQEDSSSRLRPRGRLRQATAMLFGLAVGVGYGIIVDEGVGLYRQHETQIADAQLAPQLGVSPNQVPLKDAQQYVSDRSIILRGLNDLDALLEKNSTDTTDTASTPGIELPGTGVGNAGSTSANVPIWLVTPKGDSSSIENHWAIGSSNYLDDSDVQDMHWVESEQYQLRFNAPTSPAPGSLVVAEIQNSVSLTSLEDSGAYIKLPLLQGTGPIAANINGKSVKLIKMTDGSYGVADLEGVTGTLKYWVGPTGEHITPANPVTDSEKTAPSQLQLSKNIPASLGITENYIQENFTYNLNPITIHNKRATTLQEWDTATMASREANCNVANTILAMSDPKRTDNILFGYGGAQQEKNGQWALMSHGAHMWTVGGDATPYKGMSAADKAFFSVDNNESQPTEDPMEKDMLLGFGVLQAVGATYLSRRPIARTARQQQQAANNFVRSKIHTFATRKLANIDLETLTTSLTLAQAAAYGPSIDVDTELARAQDTLAEIVYPETIALSLREKLVDEAPLHSGKVLARLRGAGVSKQVLRTIKSARQANL